MSELKAHTYLASRRRQRGYIAGAILGIGHAIVLAVCALSGRGNRDTAHGASVPARVERIHFCEVNDHT